MDISNIAAISSDLAQRQTGDAVSISVLRKALDIEKQNAMQLLQALPQPVANPAHLGNSVDVRA